MDDETLIREMNKLPKMESSEYGDLVFWDGVLGNGKRSKEGVAVYLTSQNPYGFHLAGIRWRSISRTKYGHLGNFVPGRFNLWNISHLAKQKLLSPELAIFFNDIRNQILAHSGT